MESQGRRYDIDWLRVIAIGLLILYHTGIGFQPWGVLIGFIQNDKPLEYLWVPMSMMNIWRIPLLFFVSGMGVSFAMRKRSFKQLLAERSRRILLPFLFGIAAIVPLHLFLWQNYYNQDINYTIQQSHLWFLGNIFSYVIILSPLFIYLRNNLYCRVNKILRAIYSSPVGLVVVASFFVVEVLILKPDTYETYASTLHGYFVGLLSFLFGFTFIISGSAFWDSVKRWRMLYLIVAVLLFIFRYILFDLQSPGYLRALESILWIFAAFGYAYRYLNHASGLLSYLSKAAYPVYILHMLFLYLASYFIMPAGISPEFKCLIITTFTFTSCMVVYEYVIRRVKILRPVFGLKIEDYKHKNKQYGFTKRHKPAL